MIKKTEALVTVLLALVTLLFAIGGAIFCSAWNLVGITSWSALIVGIVVSGMAAYLWLMIYGKAKVDLFRVGLLAFFMIPGLSSIATFPISIFWIFTAASLNGWFLLFVSLFLGFVFAIGLFICLADNTMKHEDFY